MRLLPLIFIMLTGSLVAGESAPSYPLWDNHESVADYAKRANLPPTKTLDLGNGVKMELVLIPAGKFMMGTPEPTPVDEEGFRNKIITGQALMAFGIGVLLLLLGAVIVQAIRNRRRPNFSLARLLAMTAMASIAVLSGLHWRQSVLGLKQARLDFIAANARLNVAMQTWDAGAPERHAHPVTLTRPFYMGQFVATQEQYQHVIGTNPSRLKSKDRPVEYVFWDDAQAFCKKLTEQTKQTVRLPTEAEWEYACRAGTTTAYYSGDTEADLARVAWYGMNSNGTMPVGQKEPNAFGLYDMHGNVPQWCEDWWDDKYYSKSPTEDPQGPDHGIYRVLRGNDWADGPEDARSAYRFRGRSGGGNDFTGFRVVMPVSKSP